MRQIKYRAWHKKRKVMCDVLRIDCHNKTISAMSFTSSFKQDRGDFEAYEIMRFTGAVDKNGMDIFEGDRIVHIVRPLIRGIVKYGKYKNPFDNDSCGHVGFHVYWKDEEVEYSRKDLDFWAKVSNVDSNIYETED